MEESCPHPFWIDTHCHLDFAAGVKSGDDFLVGDNSLGSKSLLGAGNPLGGKSPLGADNSLGSKSPFLQLQELGIRGWSATVKPSDFERTFRCVEDTIHVAGLGFHPWWVASDSFEDELDVFGAQLHRTNLVSEVGLDLSLRHIHSQVYQQRVFSHIAQACARATNKVLSLHAVRSVQEVCFELEQAQVLDGCAVIFHWFSGTPEQLRQALRMGCSFSVGAAMLASKRGRATVSHIPIERLLLETDLPTREGEAIDACAWKAQIEETVEKLASLKGMSGEEMGFHLRQNATLLLK